MDTTEKKILPADWFMDDLGSPMVMINGEKHYLKSVRVFPAIQLELLNGTVIAISRFTIEKINELSDKVGMRLKEPVNGQ